MAVSRRVRHLTSALALMGLALACASLGHAANLVFDSSFENAVGAGTIAEGWDSQGTPPEGANCVSDTRAHSGKLSHQITVPDAAPLNWYQIRQSIPMLTPGQTVTLSVYVWSENLRDGAGAYCSLNCFTGVDQRVGVFDAPTKATGTSTGWQRQSVTATIPAKTNQVVIILTLYGHGAVPPTAQTTAKLSWPGLSGKHVELGELRSAKWTGLEPLQPGRDGGLSYDTEQSLQMILAATPEQFGAARAVVERFATNP